MKDIKSYVIGFLTCACLFLIMGQTKSDNQNGRYQAWDSTSIMSRMIDTQTGEVYGIEIMKKNERKKHNKEGETNIVWLWSKMGLSVKK